MAGKKVLVVDDEKLIVKGIRFSLEQDNMEVDCAYDGEEALQMAHNKEYDIILLDVMLPKLTGFEVCQQTREFSNVPVIMLTAKGDDMDKILGLEYGADDYITKPFNILEVKARIKAIFRRMEPKKGTTENTGILESGDRSWIVTAKEPTSRAGDRTDGQGVRSAGTSDAESRQGIQQGEFVEAGMGYGLSR